MHEASGVHPTAPYNGALMCKMQQVIVTDKDVEGDEEDRHPVVDCPVGGDVERPSQRSDRQTS
jgi:hypothetical protein